MNALARRKARQHQRAADRWDRHPGWMTVLWVSFFAVSAVRRYRAVRDLLAARAAVERKRTETAAYDARLASAMADLRREYAPTQWAADVLRFTRAAEDAEEADDA